MPEVLAVQPFPNQPDKVDPDWLTERLQQSGAIGPEHRVVGFSSSPLGEGIGMLGIIARFKLEYAGEPGPIETLVVKCATPAEANRAVAMTFRMYEREVRFFQLLADRLPEGIPRCYYAEIDLSTGDFILLMEDFFGYRQGDQAAGCDVPDAELGIDAMARLHAVWWGATDRAEFAWVPTVDGELHRMMVPATAGSWDPFIAKFGHLVAPEIVEVGPRYLASLADLHTRMGQGPQTLIHGDFRLDNILYGVRPDQHRIALLDWQGVIVSKGVHDLAYLLSQNLVTESRRTHERNLVERYHTRLGEGGVTGYSLEQCWDDYRLAVLWLFEYAVVIGGALDPANDRGSAFMSGLIERSSTAIMDLGLLDLLPAS